MDGAANLISIIKKKVVRYNAQKVGDYENVVTGNQDLS